MEMEEKIDAALEALKQELLFATEKFGAFNSPHEGKAIIEEELEELWEHCRANDGTSDDAIKEAFQVAAMGLRYVVDFGKIGFIQSVKYDFEDKRRELKRIGFNVQK